MVRSVRNTGPAVRDRSVPGLELELVMASPEEQEEEERLVAYAALGGCRVWCGTGGGWCVTLPDGTWLRLEHDRQYSVWASKRVAAKAACRWLGLDWLV